MVAPLVMMGLSLAGDLVGKLSSSVSNATSAKPDPTGQTRKTADDFETMFLENSLDRLTENAGEDGPLGNNGTGGGVYRSMLSNQYAKSIVKSGGVGIADQVYSQMLKMQEVPGGPNG